MSYGCINGNSSALAQNWSCPSALFQIFAVLSQTVPGVWIALSSSLSDVNKEETTQAFWIDTQTYLKWKDPLQTNSHWAVTGPTWHWLTAWRVRNEQCPTCVQSHEDRKKGKRGCSQSLNRGNIKWKECSGWGKWEQRSPGTGTSPVFLQNVCGKAKDSTLISIKHLLHLVLQLQRPII